MDASSVERGSVQVTTVSGPVPADELGMTLTHEHLVSDWTLRAVEPEGGAERKLFHGRVDASINWLLTDDPWCCLDNGRQDDTEAMIEELRHFIDAGGTTIVDCTNGDIGRDPRGLKEISARTGLNVVMGSGWYIHRFHDEHKASAGADELCDELVDEFENGVGGTGVRPGIIGEIGVSPKFTDAEKTRLRAACRAQHRLRVPLFVHLPGWQRRAFEVLDIVMKDEGVAPDAVVLCHMDPSGGDVDYQRSVAEHGVWLGFDMIGMPYYYAGEGQSPAPDQTACAIAGLIRDGYAAQILLSHDLAAKSMWTRNGGNGVGYVPRLFLPRLQRHGVPAEVTAALLTTNPRQLFTVAREGAL
ncbi:phosphotriesterase family protein [Mycobacterium saskatchewanense]|uniref:phosphotriesterase family protein n=1 Tax=Mycobacterium saskatchewanense TaxID=220927 RepID=UPI00115352DF|nr:phosphotriesterase [Mycobacterium saskatchewanense]